MPASRRASKKEVEALWAALFGGPPSIDATPEMLIEVLVRCLPQPAPYGYDDPSSPARRIAGDPPEE